MLNFNSILVFSEKPADLAAFYKKLLQKESDWSEGGYVGFQAGSCFLTIGPHDQVRGKSQNPERIMINFEIENVKGEFERIKKLGATVVKDPYQPSEEPNMWIATFSDPDGNYFQIMTPFKTK